MKTQSVQIAHSYTRDGVNYIWTMPAERLGKYWTQIVKFLLMVEKPDWTVDQVFEQIANKQAQVWGAVNDGEIRAIWITKLMENNEKFGLVWIAAGIGTETLSLEDGTQLFFECTEKWFKEMGCAYIKIVGRRGWKKALPGFVEHAVELRKVL